MKFYDPYKFDSYSPEQQKEILQGLFLGTYRPNYKNVLFTSHPEDPTPVKIFKKIRKHYR